MVMVVTWNACKASSGMRPPQALGSQFWDSQRNIHCRNETPPKTKRQHAEICRCCWCFEQKFRAIFLLREIQNMNLKYFLLRNLFGGDQTVTKRTWLGRDHPPAWPRGSPPEPPWACRRTGQVGTVVPVRDATWATGSHRKLIKMVEL